MYEQRTCQLLFACVVFGTVLQMIGIFTPGWYIVSSTKLSYSSSSGIWSNRVCENDGRHCETTTFYEHYLESMDESPKSSAGVVYAVQVGIQVIAVITLMCCLLSCLLSFIILRNQTDKSRLSLLTTCFLLVAGSLIWTVIGELSAVMAARRRIDDNSEIGFPYSICLTAIGSVFTLSVALVNFRALWIEKQPISNPETYTAQLIQQPVHVNTGTYPPQQQQGYIHSY